MPSQAAQAKRDKRFYTFLKWAAIITFLTLAWNLGEQKRESEGIFPEDNPSNSPSPTIIHTREREVARYGEPPQEFSALPSTFKR